MQVLSQNNNNNNNNNWQVVENIYDCWKYMYVDLYMLKMWLLAGCGSIYIENMTVSRMQKLYRKCDHWNSCWIWKKKKKTIGKK